MQEAESVGWAPLLALTGGIFLSILLLLVMAPAVGFLIAVALSVVLIIGSLTVFILALYRRRPRAP